MHLAGTMYEGANHTHLSELLSEREGIDIGRTTLRRILVSAVMESPRKRRPPKHRVRRQRMPREGMLIQLDGSHHRWLAEEGRGSRCSSRWTTPPAMWSTLSSVSRRTASAISG